MLTKSLFQLLERRSLPLPKHYQINITEHQKRNEKGLNTERQSLTDRKQHCSFIVNKKGLTSLEDTALC